MTSLIKMNVMIYVSKFKVLNLAILILFAPLYSVAKEVFLISFLQQDTSKSIIGEYFSPHQDVNKFTSESILLRNDSTFEYRIKDEFINLMAIGNWHVSRGQLVLNSIPKRPKIIVEEAISRQNANKIKFDVTYTNHNPLNYQLYLISNKGIFCYKDLYHDTVINYPDLLKGFFIIDTRGFKYPTYFLKNRKSNYFRIKLEIDRIFDNEKWRIANGKLEPIGLNGKISSYYLSKDGK